ncbi:hypothetical protein [Duncaniella muris]|uniref:hypothetical protein n=1 Tax=Duncaniella muris TaxID=2094150 RepID=UPI0025A9A35E|nr:hypothetical protein [Duncaniella muris]
MTAPLSTPPPDLPAPKSWKNGKNRPKNLGKTAKTGKIALEKRQKSPEKPWKNGKNKLFLQKADSAWHYSDT